MNIDKIADLSSALQLPTSKPQPMSNLSTWWPYLVAIVSAGYVLYEKIGSRQKEKIAIRQSYNRVYAKALKLQFSYYKRKEIYANKLGIPMENHLEIVKILDTFDRDLDEFKKILNDESAIIPEIIISTNFLWDLVDRTKLLDMVSLKDIDPEKQEAVRFAMKKAQLYSYEPVLDEMFGDITTLIGKQSSVKIRVQKSMATLHKPENQVSYQQTENEIMKRYLFALKEQGVIGEELFDQFNKTQELKKE
jgi:hypothetical protein